MRDKRLILLQEVGFVYRTVRGELPKTTLVVALVTVLVTGLDLVHPQIGRALQRTPAAIDAHEWWRFITPILINPEGWRQITFNLVSLILIGAIVERQWGGRLWLAFYVIGGVAGEAVGLAWQPIGAGSSVAVCGLLGSLVVSLVLCVRTGPARFGGIFILTGALLLIGLRDLHGPPVLAGASVAAIVWFVRRIAR